MSTTAEPVLVTVTQIVATELATTADAIDPDLDLRTVAGADSVKVLRMIARIERAYDIELDDEDVFTVTTVREVTDVVERALAAGAAA
ncbi:acyl carrier protein [Frankia sp. Mgl5]|uniref:Phosphopantetheine-binding protein n=1 Tax=Parafrankia soli TaxID=2599596 RepID=A0A1S1Q5N0_9ACTN|nr:MULTISPECIES: acyl carrier protein [Frankiaceae]ABW13358.1 phosphopantetheine-binding [Frankia sp. EAN1pec]CAI7977081.1 acyl carrier protein [Frankia sp. Hr75.2]MCK9926389.1 acyl carrier protein [Frankia sp. Mgl5]OHV28907.1 phosphopantetheine-binding protein [Parafrankia soli]TCJ31672.1 acyl carrier protein [Parafrankia sp. BMG5.11]